METGFSVTGTLSLNLNFNNIHELCWAHCSIINDEHCDFITDIVASYNKKALQESDVEHELLAKISTQRKGILGRIQDYFHYSKTEYSSYYIDNTEKIIYSLGHVFSSEMTDWELLGEIYNNTERQKALLCDRICNEAEFCRQLWQVHENSCLDTWYIGEHLRFGIWPVFSGKENTDKNTDINTDKKTEFFYEICLR